MKIKNYDDIGIAIRQHSIIAQANLAEYQYYKDMLELHIPRHLTTLRLDGLPANKFPYVPVDIVMDKMQILEKEIALEVRAIKRLKKQKKAFEDFINSLNGLHYFIAQMHLIDQRQLKEIALSTGYSYDYIRHMASDIKEKFYTLSDDTTTQLSHNNFTN